LLNPIAKCAYNTGRGERLCGGGYDNVGEATALTVHNRVAAETIDLNAVGIN